MGKRVIVVVVGILIIGAIALGLTRNNDNQSNPQSSSNQTPQNSQNQTGSQTPASTNSVAIQNFAFLPGDITVKKGTTVTWTNKDSTPHSVNEMDGEQGPDSGSLNSGDKYSFTFNDVGTFKYRCDIHPEMLGTVTVTD